MTINANLLTHEVRYETNKLFNKCKIVRVETNDITKGNAATTFARCLTQTMLDSSFLKILQLSYSFNEPKILTE